MASVLGAMFLARVLLSWSEVPLTLTRVLGLGFAVWLDVPDLGIKDRTTYRTSRKEQVCIADTGLAKHMTAATALVYGSVAVAGMTVTTVGDLCHGARSFPNPEPEGV